MDLEEIGINEGNWIDSAQDRDSWRALVSAALNNRRPPPKKRKLNYKPEGRRNLGRPQTRWGDNFREEGTGQGA